MWDGPNCDARDPEPEDECGETSEMSQSLRHLKLPPGRGWGLEGELEAVGGVRCVRAVTEPSETLDEESG